MISKNVEERAKQTIHDSVKTKKSLENKKVKRRKTEFKNWIFWGKKWSAYENREGPKNILRGRGGLPQIWGGEVGSSILTHFWGA